MNQERVARSAETADKEIQLRGDGGGPPHRMHPYHQRQLPPLPPDNYENPYPHNYENQHPLNYSDHNRRNEYCRDRYFTPSATPLLQTPPVSSEHFSRTPFPLGPALYAHNSPAPAPFLPLSPEIYPPRGPAPNTPASHYFSEWPPLPPRQWTPPPPSNCLSGYKQNFKPRRNMPRRNTALRGRRSQNRKLKQAPAKASRNIIPVKANKRSAGDISTLEPPAKKICLESFPSPDSIATCSPGSSGADSPKSELPQLSFSLKIEAPLPGPHPNFLQAYPTKTFSASELQELLPSEWASDRVTLFDSKGLFRRDVTKVLSERTNAVRKEVEGRCKFRISEIEAVENPYLWLMYQLRRWEMAEMQGGNVAKELFLFHGTKGNNIYPIIKDNFDFRLAGTNKGHRYGHGVNFCSKANFCKIYSKDGLCLLVARVPILRACIGRETTLLPDKGYDATHNGRDIFVKFNDHEFYPELLVHFREV